MQKPPSSSIYSMHNICPKNIAFFSDLHLFFLKICHFQCWLYRGKCKFLMPTDKKETIQLIGDLRVKKVSDIYGLSTEFVKAISHCIAPILSGIFNKRFETAIFPDHMKIAIISPIFKGGSRLEVSNYRPASVLPILNKILKRLIQNRLTKRLDEDKIIYEHQYGFQKNKSTTLAVLDLYSEILKTNMKREYDRSVFLVFSKIVDKVDQSILLKKLEHYVIRGVPNKWFGSYLNKRYQNVKINGKLSKKEIITCGIPQGSILGLVIFFLYINDIKIPQ